MITTQLKKPLIHEPAEAYHAKSGAYLSSHLLAAFRACPLLYHRKRRGMIGDSDRPAFLLGRALHTLVLEGREKFDSEFVVGGPINPKTGKTFGEDTKAYAEWAAQQGKQCLTFEQAALVDQMAAGVRANDAVRGLLFEGVAEGVVRCDYHGVPSQIRLDWLGAVRGNGAGAGIVDLKTCDDLAWFESDARRFGYSHQLAFYRAVLAAATGVSPLQIPVHLVAVEKREPFRCGVWLMSEEVLGIAQKENEAAIERLKCCETTGIFPTGYETPRTFDWI